MPVLYTGAELYKEVKRASDSYIGVPSQCFVTRKASIGVPQVGKPALSLAPGVIHRFADAGLKLTAKLLMLLMHICCCSWTYTFLKQGF